MSPPLLAQSGHSSVADQGPLSERLFHRLSSPSPPSSLVVRLFPDRVARRPERYAMPKDKSVADVKAELVSVLASELLARKFSYARSDGSAWTLSLKDVVDRAVDLEMAYNLNDCVELRWGASENSEEASTCNRHAPSAQREKMTEYRPWFHERHWPSRA